MGRILVGGPKIFLMREMDFPGLNQHIEQAINQGGWGSAKAITGPER